MEQNDPTYQANEKHKNRNAFAGLILLLVGGALLVRQFGANLPNWIFSWQTLLIVLGIFIGVKNNFRNFSWLAITAVGVVFLLDEMYPDLALRNFAWPLLIIAVGLFIIFAPNRSRNVRRKYLQDNENKDYAFFEGAVDVQRSPNDVLDIVSIFGSVKKLVISKSFAGGEVVCIFGGTEINLTQADGLKPMVIDVVQIFGGTKLIVPANWEVRSEAVALLGGIEDKRGQTTSAPDKVLILKGTTIFGGIEINSF
jgi:predicted membrane protein